MYSGIPDARPYWHAGCAHIPVCSCGFLSLLLNCFHQLAKSLLDWTASLWLEAAAGLGPAETACAVEGLPVAIMAAGWSWIEVRCCGRRLEHQVLRRLDVEVRAGLRGRDRKGATGRSACDGRDMGCRMCRRRSCRPLLRAWT